MCSTEPFGFKWSRGYVHNLSYYHFQIRSINLSDCCHGFFAVGYLRSLYQHISSVIVYAIYCLFFQLTYSSFECYENICILSHYYHQIRNMSHKSLSMVRSWNNGIRSVTRYVFLYITCLRDIKTCRVSNDIIQLLHNIPMWMMKQMKAIEIIHIAVEIPKCTLISYCYLWLIGHLYFVISDKVCIVFNT